ncbi:MAG: methionyl-tRNA formyltransferase, partial [Prevotella sp.]
MKKEDLRIIFMGTPEFAVESLKSLVEGGYNVVAVVTQPDKAVGRHQDQLQPSQVKQYAVEHNLPILQPVKMKDPEFVESLRAYKADLQVVVAFRMLPEIVWDMPRFGTFNVHAALLPQYRGAAPINWAIINGETETGVTTFFLDKDIDTGKIIMQKHFPIPDDEDVEYVYDGLMKLGAQAAMETIDMIVANDGNVDAIEQSQFAGPECGELKAAPKIFKETCQIDWNKTAKEVHDFVRGLSPYPGTWTNMTEGEDKTSVLKIFKTTKTDIHEDAKPGTVFKEKMLSCSD